MIIFHVDQSGHVRTVPSSIPQGSSQVEAVIYGDATHSLCTLRLMPPSNEYIEDIVCVPNNPFTDTKKLWSVRLPDALTSRAGIAKYQLIFTSPDGKQQATTSGSISVTPGVLSDMPPTVEDLSQYSLSQFYTLFSNLYATVTVLNNLTFDISKIVRGNNGDVALEHYDHVIEAINALYHTCHVDFNHRFHDLHNTNAVFLEVLDHINGRLDDYGAEVLQTQKKNIVGGINELKTDCEKLENVCISLIHELYTLSQKAENLQQLLDGGTSQSLITDSPYIVGAINELKQTAEVILQLDAVTLDRIQNLISMIKSDEELSHVLADKISVTDIVDDLATDDATRPLSARQGKKLWDKLENEFDFEELFSRLVDRIFPVGSYYITEGLAQNPQNLFGGTWKMVQDKFLLGGCFTYLPGTEGGTPTVTLTASQMPAHDHIVTEGDSGRTLGYQGKLFADVSWGVAYATNGRASTFRTTKAGGGEAFSIMPPYKAVCIWYRTA